jgi:hypothetical protein
VTGSFGATYRRDRLARKLFVIVVARRGDDNRGDAGTSRSNSAGDERLAPGETSSSSALLSRRDLRSRAVTVTREAYISLTEYTASASFADYTPGDGRARSAPAPDREVS